MERVEKQSLEVGAKIACLSAEQGSGLRLSIASSILNRTDLCSFDPLIWGSE